MTRGSATTSTPKNRKISATVHNNAPARDGWHPRVGRNWPRNCNDLPGNHPLVRPLLHRTGARRGIDEDDPVEVVAHLDRMRHLALALEDRTNRTHQVRNVKPVGQLPLARELMGATLRNHSLLLSEVSWMGATYTLPHLLIRLWWVPLSPLHRCDGCHVQNAPLS